MDIILLSDNYIKQLANLLILYFSRVNWTTRDPENNLLLNVNLFLEVSFCLEMLIYQVFCLWQSFKMCYRNIRFIKEGRRLK